MTMNRSVPATAAPQQSLLRGALRLDAAASGALALLLLAAGAFVTELLGLPLALLWSAGVFLLGYAAALWLLAGRADIAAGMAWSVVAVNALWVLGSILVLAAAQVTLLGGAVVAAQALAVVAFAAAQAVGTRRLSAAAHR